VGQVSKNYGLLDDGIRRWCGGCGRAHGAVLLTRAGLERLGFDGRPGAFGGRQAEGVGRGPCPSGRQCKDCDQPAGADVGCQSVLSQSQGLSKDRPAG
jgi:hypothetical protein